MTTTAIPTRYTPADVERLSHQTGKLYELVDGELVEKVVSTLANWIAGQIVTLLNSLYGPNRAYAFIEQPTYCFDDAFKEGKRPDVCMVWAERLPDGPNDDELYVAPDLVVEVVSPTNRFSQQHSRVRKYLRAGVTIVWVIDPSSREMFVFRRGRKTADILQEDDVYENDPLLPGLTFKLSQVLPPKPAVKTP
jgi:Uma2 family endonuclease